MRDYLFIIPNIIFKLLFQKIIISNVKARKIYLKFAKFMATNGFNPPLTVCSWWQERAWAGQDFDNKSINISAYLSSTGSTEKLFEEVLPLLDKDAKILELGCNVGRNLHYLYERGYKNLTGIEISPKALGAMNTYFPEMSKKIKKIEGNIAKELKKLDSKAYDLVFCHSVLVNISSVHNHVFREICRICRGYVVTLESEGSYTAYPRDFQKMFEKHNFYMRSFKFMVRDKDRALIIPRKITDENIFKNATIRFFVEKI